MASPANPAEPSLEPPTELSAELSAKPPTQPLFHVSVQSLVEQAAAPAQVPFKNKTIQVKLISRKYDGPVPSREGFAYGGRQLRSEDFSVTITSQTTFNSLVRHLQKTMQRLKMGDFDRPYNQGVFRSMKILEAAEPEDVVERPTRKWGLKKLDAFKMLGRSKKVNVITKVIDLNWATCRQILLDQDCTLQFEAWAAAENWDWYLAIQQTKDKEISGCRMQ